MPSKIGCFFFQMAYSIGKAYVYALIYIFGSLQFGFSLTFYSFVVSGLQNEYPNWDTEKDNNLITYFNTFTALFASIGGVIIHFLLLVLKRRIVVFIYSFVSLVIWLLFLVVRPDIFYVGVILRSLQGVIIGGFVTITPILMTEIAPDDETGRFGCMNQCGIAFGMCAMQFLGAFIQWRYLIVVAAVFSALYCILIWLTPEWKQDKFESMKSRRFIQPIFVVVFMMIFQQFCGMNAILDNLSTILAQSGLQIDSNLQSALSTFAQFLSCIIASFNMDVVGRKGMFLFSVSGVLLVLILYTVSLKVELPGWYPAICIFLLMLFFGHGLGPIPWFITYDLFPPGTRTVGLSITTFANMLSSFTVVFLFPVMTDNLGDFVSEIIFIVITIFSIPFGVFGIPNFAKKDGDGVTLI